jgi:hypothetical protein
MRNKNILSAAGQAAGQAASVSIAFAQQAAALSWKQGIASDEASSTLHPFALHFIGRPASERELGLDKINDEVNVTKADLASFNGHVNAISDIDAVLLKFIPDRADYWDGPSSKMVRAFGTIASVIAGKPVALGAHGSLTALSAATQATAPALRP